VERWGQIDGVRSDLVGPIKTLEGVRPDFVRATQAPCWAFFVFLTVHQSVETFQRVGVATMPKGPKRPASPMGLPTQPAA